MDAPMVDDDGKPTGETLRVERDEGLRDTSLEKLATLKAVMEGGVHTAGSSSQITDGASAVILASQDAVKRLGLRPRARIVYTTIVGVEPETMLKGPIPATEKLLERTGLKIDRHGRLRGERGVRERGAGLAAGGGCSRRSASTRTAAPSPSDIRPAPPATA